MEFVYTFESFINKLNEGLIKSYDIDKTTQDIDRLLTSYNLKYSRNILNNNTFQIFIDDLDRIKYLKETLEYILGTLFNLYGWFPSKMNTNNVNGYKNSDKFSLDYILNPYNNVIGVEITFESKFDKIDTNIPEKLYHLSIQQYEKDILQKGILPKGKSKLSSHDYDGRVYLCKGIDDCKNLINPMNIFYSKEKDSILYSGKNKNKIYNKNTNWVIYEIDTNIGNINELYQDPNYINGYYYLYHIKKEAIEIVDYKK